MADINNPDDKLSPYHNLTAYLTKGKKSEGFNDMIDFLCRSKIYFALTTNPTIYIPHMEDFWSTAVYSTEQGIPQIKAKVDGKDITISEATLRKYLKLQDEGAAISYSKDEYMRTFVSIGYTGNQTEYTIEKALMGPPWKYLCHTLLQCISQKRSGWHQVRSALASVFHGMVTSLGFKFAHLIFEGLRYNLQEGAKQQFFMYPRFLQEVFNQELKELSKHARIYIMLGHKNNIFQSMRTVSKKFSGVNIPLLYTMLNIQSTPGDSSAIPADTDPTPSTSHPEQQSASPFEPLCILLRMHRKRGKRTPSSLASKAQTKPNSPHSESQYSDDVPSPTTPISEVLIDLASNTLNPSSSTLKVHSRSYERMDVEEAVTTAGPSNDQGDSDNIAKTSTTATHSEDDSLETPLTERNPRRQETMGDGDAEAKPKAPSGSKDSTTVDEDRLKLHNLELTARVAMLEAEVSKLRHQVSMHEAHQCPTVPTPSLVLVGTQTDAYSSTDATKKGKMVPLEEDTDTSDDEEEETTEDWKLVVKAVDEMLTDAEDRDQTYTSFSIIPEAATIISQSTAPQFTLTSTQLEFDTILAWGYDGKSERFWIGWEFGGVEELNRDFLNSIQVLHLYHLQCINNSMDLSAELAIGRFYDLMEDNLPNFERQIQAAKRVAYPESSTAAERRLTPRRLEIIRSSLLTEEEVLCWRRFLYSRMVRDFEVQGWISTDSHDFTFFLSNGSSLTINIKDILLLPSTFLHKVF
ncbi:hypothetical protein L1987_12976 [Smallanthus sonchifolius]|uniref:Uncharacterized protein n=1 Tax=Smallanthus sonchifolius TaxID=185202 RepID=A0ACB9JHI6_9ASTR|nr:hypothetical protein L1987_12976 [Smallanthus sonchifolius]